MPIKKLLKQRWFKPTIVLVGIILIFICSIQGIKFYTVSQCKEAVKDRLKAPSTALFSKIEVGYHYGLGLFVKGLVESQNGFGGMVGDKFYCWEGYKGKEIEFENDENSVYRGFERDLKDNSSFYELMRNFNRIFEYLSNIGDTGQINNEDKIVENDFINLSAEETCKLLISDIIKNDDVIYKETTYNDIGDNIKIEIEVDGKGKYVCLQDKTKQKGINRNYIYASYKI